MFSRNGGRGLNIRTIYRQMARTLRQTALASGVAGAREPSEEMRLRAEIRAVCAQMEQADTVFDNVTDPDLIDASVFTMRACERKLGYLFKQAKAQRAAMALEAVDARYNQAPRIP
jgi:hypothetical protein